MSEGEKKIYKPGDRVTFRLPKKIKITEVVNFINASESKEMGPNIVAAIQFYCKYKDKYKEIEAFEFMLDKFLTSGNLDIRQFASTSIKTEKENEVYIEEEVAISNNKIEAEKVIKEEKPKVISFTTNNVTEDQDEDDDANDELFGEPSTNRRVNPLLKAMKSVRR